MNTTAGLLTDQVVIITGASAGIGAATARAAHAAGAHLVLMARRAERLQLLAAELDADSPDRPVLVLPGDVTDPTVRTAAVRDAVARHGRIDVLVNNAGHGGYSPVSEIDSAHYQAMWALNVDAPLAMMQSVIPIMRAHKRGTIVNVSSGASRAIYPTTGGYASTKAALNHLTAVARAELAADGITVSALLPYLTETDFNENLLSGSAVLAPAEAPAHTADHVAQALLALIASSEAELSLVPA